MSSDIVVGRGLFRAVAYRAIIAIDRKRKCALPYFSRSHSWKTDSRDLGAVDGLLDTACEEKKVRRLNGRARAEEESM